MRKRILLIAYYFPPLGMSGVQRVLKWAKYLPENGWDVTVLTARPASYFARDESLLDDLRGRNVEIIRTRSIDPTRWVRSSRVTLPREEKKRILSRISQSIFQPDNKIGWYPFARAAGLTVLKKRRFDAILSSAPPYTSHLIGASLSRQTNVPLFLEYRDDWIQNPRHNYPTTWHKQYAVDLEQKVFKQAAGIIAINQEIAENIKSRAGQLLSDNQICVIPHGYDPDDLRLEQGGGATKSGPDSSKVVEFLYNGVFYDVQKPDTFLRGFAQFLNSHPDERSNIRARFVGLTPDYMQALVGELNLSDCVIVDGYLDHAAASTRLMASDVLWMTVGKSPGSGMISTSKLFEYIGTGKPILGLVPDGEAQKALALYGSSVVVDPDDINATAEAIATLFNAVGQNTQTLPNTSFVHAHNRKALARRLSEFLTN